MWNTLLGHNVITCTFEMLVEFNQNLNFNKTRVTPLGLSDVIDNVDLTVITNSTASLKWVRFRKISSQVSCLSRIMLQSTSKQSTPTEDRRYRVPSCVVRTNFGDFIFTGVQDTTMVANTVWWEKGIYLCVVSPPPFCISSSYFNLFLSFFLVQIT